MNQGQLKKEFTKKDVTRMRNLITGKSGEKTQIQSGYEKNQEDHKEGDVWQDSSGKSWTIKNGIKRTATKLNNLKKLVEVARTEGNTNSSLIESISSIEKRHQMVSLLSTFFDT